MIHWGRRIDCFRPDLPCPNRFRFPFILSQVPKHIA